MPTRHSLWLLLFASSALFAQQQPVPLSQLQQQAEARQAELERKQAPLGFRPSDLSPQTPPAATVADPGRCLNIHTLHIDSQEAAFFRRYVAKSLPQLKLRGKRVGDSTLSIQQKSGKSACLSGANIEQLAKLTQNAIIDAGWITARVFVPEQDLNRGELTFTILPGYAGTVSLAPESAGQRAPFFASTVPVSTGEKLSLRDIEQGLENLRRLPSVQAEIDIAPGADEGRSDLRIRWQQSRWYRFNFSLDDSGSKATGKYLGTISLAVDNPLRLSDSLNLNYSRNLTPGQRRTSLSGHSGRGRTDNYSANYSVPLGYWSFDLSASRYYYDQAVAGQTRTYHYRGTSTQEQAGVSRTLYRSARSKLDASVGLWQKTNKSYVDDAEITVQRRRQGGWQAGLEHTVYFDDASLYSQLQYKKGTGIFSSLPAPETALGEGTARFGIWSADINWQKNFTLGKQAFAWNSRLHGQWTANRLTPVDRMSIGGRYNVRGFNGEITLSGDRGWYLRNDLQWHFQPQHSLYLALDGGSVAGPSARNLPGKHLIGSALGIKGQHNWHGRWNYDLFVGTPVRQPQGMNADRFVTGFQFGYSF